MSNNPLISVFMPVYNGEQYLSKSIESVLNQSLKDFELVCVDDSSTDNSYNQLLEYAKKDKRLIVLRKTNGGSVPISWNYAMQYLSGKFITYMSQDDWMSGDNLQLNYSRYLETGANIIVPDLISCSEHKVFKNLCGINGDRNLVLTGKQAFIYSLNWKIHGFNLCEAKIMKSESFDENFFNSDEYITRNNFLISSTVAFSSGKFYYYQGNPNAITKKFGIKTITALGTDQKIIQLIKKEKLSNKITFMFILKSMIRLIYYYFRWLKTYSKSNEHNKLAFELMKKHFVFLKRSIRFY